jgi:hypothetical protein
VAALCRRLGTVADIAPTVDRAIARARELSGGDTVVAVSGSLVVVGEARDALGLPIAERLW